MPGVTVCCRSCFCFLVYKGGCWARSSPDVLYWGRGPLLGAGAVHSGHKRGEHTGCGQLQPHKPRLLDCELKLWARDGGCAHLGAAAPGRLVRGALLAGNPTCCTPAIAAQSKVGSMIPGLVLGGICLVGFLFMLVWVSLRARRRPPAAMCARQFGAANSAAQALRVWAPPPHLSCLQHSTPTLCGRPAALGRCACGGRGSGGGERRPKQPKRRSSSSSNSNSWRHMAAAWPARHLPSTIRRR